MDLRSEIKRLEANNARLRNRILDVLASLPQNSKIKMLSVQPRCFTIGSSDLGNNWSPEHHDFALTYQFVGRVLEKTGLNDVRAVLARIVRSGKIVGQDRITGVRVFYLNESARRALRGAFYGDRGSTRAAAAV